jgi:TRAP-type uncharacterized transport system substrate-binding protein
MLGFNRWRLLRMVAAMLCVAGVAWLALVYLIPAPPPRITVATALLGDHYQVLGTRYQGILSGSSIELELRTTDGAKENLGLLNDPNSGIQAGFMQGGLSNSRLSPDLLSLGRIDYQIFWLFYPTGETITDLTQLKGKRIALGPIDSGDRAVCEKILAAAGVNYDNTTLLYVPATAAAKALDDGMVDAVFLNLPLDSPLLQSLLASPQYRLMSFSEAEALTRIFPYLVRLMLPRGAIDLHRKIPVTDIDLVSTTNVVLVHKDVHPTAIDLLGPGYCRGAQQPGAVPKGRRFSYADRSGIPDRAERPGFLQEWPFGSQSVPAVLDDELCPAHPRHSRGGNRHRRSRVQLRAEALPVVHPRTRAQALSAAAPGGQGADHGPEPVRSAGRSTRAR